MVKSNKIPCYVFDLDGTLYDNSPRNCYVPIEHRSITKNWTIWNKMCHLDKVIEPTKQVLISLRSAGFHIMFATSRCIDGKQEVLNKLRCDGIACDPGSLIMRDKDDNRPSADLKVDQYALIKKLGFTIVGGFEDHPDVIEALEYHNYYMFRVNNPNKGE